MSEYRLKIWETALLLALCVSLCAGTWAQGRQTQSCLCHLSHFGQS